MPLAGETIPAPWLFKSQVEVLVTEPYLLSFRYFFVRLLNSFEQVLVPLVTQNPYGPNNKKRGWGCEGRNLVCPFRVRAWVREARMQRTACRGTAVRP